MDSLTVYQDLAPRACHNGACGLCRIKVYSGECRTNKMNRKFISIEDEWKSIFLACRVFPLSDMDIEFLPKIIKENKDKPVYRFGN